MRRLAFASAVLLLLVAATEKWWDAYDRGVDAVNAKNYKAAADALTKAIAEMPNEGTNVRAGRSLITYLPHFWLGIAKFNLGDPEGALREWRISEEQGVIARTDYYTRMKEWIARAQTERQRNAETNAGAAKKAADRAISRALETQLAALSAGGDRAESYAAATRKLQDARTQFQKAGTDVAAYRTAEQSAQQAASLFTTAADEGRRQKAARASVPPPVKAKPQQQPIQQPVQKPVVQIAAPVPQKPAPLEPLDVQVITEAEAKKAVAAQEQKRNGAAAAQTKPLVAAPAVPKPVTGPAKVDLTPAYHAYARGDLVRSEELLTRMLATRPIPEAFLLRGCARYTRAMLSRTPDRLLAGATEDFRSALQRDRSLRLDADVFSPKLVAFFEQVRTKP